MSVADATPPPSPLSTGVGGFSAGVGGMSEGAALSGFEERAAAETPPVPARGTSVDVGTAAGGVHPVYGARMARPGSWDYGIARKNYCGTQRTLGLTSACSRSGSGNGARNGNFNGRGHLER